MNKASFLDPRFKTLAHLSQNQQEEVIGSIADELLLYISATEEQHDSDDNETVTVTEVSETESDVTDPASVTTGIPHKKRKLTLLEKLLGNCCQWSSCCVKQ